MKKRHKQFYYVWESITSCLYCVEYITRAYVAPQSRKFRDPVWGRLRWARTSPALIDATSFLPYFVELMLMGKYDLPNLNFLKMFRLVRILKTESYAEAFTSASRVLRYNSEILVVTFLLTANLLLFTSTALYYLRPGLGKSSAEEVSAFSSIPDCMYICLLLLTGQGLPVNVTLPWYTKAVLLVTAVCALSMFAIPLAMLTWGFEAEAERLAKKRYVELKKRAEYIRDNGSEPPEHHESSSEDEDASEEETFENQVVAEARRSSLGVRGEPNEGKSAGMGRGVASKFMAADVDNDQKLSFEEFWDFYRDSKRGNLAPGSAPGVSKTSSSTGRLGRVQSDVSGGVSPSATLMLANELKEQRKILQAQSQALVELKAALLQLTADREPES